MTPPPWPLDEDATHSNPGSTKFGTDAKSNQVSVMTIMSGRSASHRTINSAIFFRTDRALVCNMAIEEIDDAPAEDVAGPAVVLVG